MMMGSDLIYLDHAAATPLLEKSLEAMKPYFSDVFYNPSSPYAPAVKVRSEFEAARTKLAGVIGAKPAEIILTAGATESINLAIRSIGGHAIVSAIEHESVLAAVRTFDHDILSVDHLGRIDPAAIKNLIHDDTRLISIGLANGEIGTIQPLSQIAKVVDEERARRLEVGIDTPLYFHTDASQGAGLVDLHVSRLGVDLMTLNAGKVYGPKQVGLLWVKSGVELSPLIAGGGQERGLRSGTENVAGVVGFSVALKQAEDKRNSESRRIAELRDYLEARLREEFPEVVVSGARNRRLASHLHVAFPGIDGERLVFLLEARGVLVATGSACAANKGTRSHVLTAIGLDPSIADGSLRLSLGRLSTKENIEVAAGIIVEEVRREYQRIGR